MGVSWSSPALNDAEDAVFVGSEDGNVYGIATGTGAVLWTYSTGSGVWSSPLLARVNVSVGVLVEVVLIGVEGHLLALQASDGTLVWSHFANAHVYGSASVSEDGSMVYYGSHNGYLAGVHAGTGEGSGMFLSCWGAVTSSPAIVGDMLYVGGVEGVMFGVNLTAEWSVWSVSTGSGGAVNMSSPAVGSDGVVYVGLSSGVVRAYSGWSGAELWSYSTGGSVMSSPIVDASNVVYIGSGDGKVYALQGGESGGSVLWSYSTGGEVHGSAGMDRSGNLYVG